MNSINALNILNVLFYSNKCESSKHLISLMQSENLLKFFHLVCVDTQKVPEQIKVTPTLIIRGIPTPYVGSDAFVWFSKVKQWKINMLMQKMTNAQQQYLQKIGNNLDNNNNNNILGFSKVEMENISDIFAYLTSDSAAPQSYFDYQNIGQECIFTPPLENGQYKVTSDVKCKINASKHRELCFNLELERKKQDELLKRSIEEFKKQGLRK